MKITKVIRDDGKMVLSWSDESFGMTLINFDYILRELEGHMFKITVESYEDTAT